jgi:hypothetical protein
VKWVWFKKSGAKAPPLESKALTGLIIYAGTGLQPVSEHFDLGISKTVNQSNCCDSVGVFRFKMNLTVIFDQQRQL